MSYNALGQRLGGDGSNYRAAGGVFDVAGSWSILGRGTGNTGTLVFLAEHQHRLGSGEAPELAGLAAGSALPTAQFGDFGWHLNNLHWSQKLAGDAAILVVGVVDTVDYVDYYAFNDPLTAFSNAAFAGSPTIALPDPGFGAMFRLSNGSVYLSAGVADGSAVAGDLEAGGFSSGGELFSHLEIGATPSYRERLVENVHLTIWHQAELRDAGVPEDRGVAFSLSVRANERWRPFLRAGLSNGKATLVERTLSVGTGLRLRSFDLLGVGLNWSDPSQGDRDQYTSEVFYRFQLSPSATVTPHVQVILDPALDPERSSLTAFGLRVRIAI
jgi:porin